MVQINLCTYLDSLTDFNKTENFCSTTIMMYQFNHALIKDLYTFLGLPNTVLTWQMCEEDAQDWISDECMVSISYRFHQQISGKLGKVTEKTDYQIQLCKW